MQSGSRARPGSHPEASLVELQVHMVAIPHPQRYGCAAGCCCCCCKHVLEGWERGGLERLVQGRGQGHEACHASGSSCQLWLDGER
jgi:hypothetical protein